MGKPWADHGHSHKTAWLSRSGKASPDQVSYRERTTGFEPATLTLAKKETHLLRQDRCTPLSSPSPVSSSAHSAESARLQQLTFNALNLCEIDDPRASAHARSSMRRQPNPPDMVEGVEGE